MSSSCPFELCDGTGWLEQAERTVERCACRGGAQPCLVPQCRRPASIAASMCREHWAAVPTRLRQQLRRAERAWQEGRIPTEELEQSKREALDAARQEVMHV